MLSQAPESILMVRPSNFGYNPLTARSNTFQRSDAAVPPKEINLLARKEFYYFTDFLIRSNIRTLIFEDHKDVILPDAVFPNNWVSFHHDGTVVLYPMMAENRRLERRKDILLRLQNEYNFDIKRIIDYTNYEIDGRFLEGTGSVVFDYAHKIAYSNISPRTDKIVFNKMCSDLGFEGTLFTARTPSGKDIYHTNVMMCIGSNFVVICLEAVPDESTRTALFESFEKTRHEVVEISFRQLASFAGNVIEVLTQDGDTALIMSESAFRSLDKVQLSRLSRHAEILHVPIPVIEEYGGGSARCMIAGIFLPQIKKSK
jgi:hypothetical protein